MIKHQVSVYGIHSLRYDDRAARESMNMDSQFVKFHPKTFEVDMTNNYGKVLSAIENDCETQLGYDDVLNVYVIDMANDEYEPKAIVRGTYKAIRHFVLAMRKCDVQFEISNWR